jgi:cytochrome P450
MTETLVRADLTRIEASLSGAPFFPHDLTDDEFRQVALRDYIPEWANSPPFYVRRNGIAGLLCTRAADVRAVYMDAERFVMKSPGLPGYEVFDVFGGLESVLQMDGERHSRVRRLMNPAFSPVGLVDIRASVDKIIAERLDAIEAAGPAFDAMGDFCNTLTMRSLLDATFHLSEEQQQVFERMHNSIAMATQFRPGEARPQAFTDAVIAVRQVISDVIVERRRTPGTDFISRLITARDEGSKLSDEELYGQINTICGAAIGSTAGSLGAVLYTLGRNVDQFDKLKRDPDMIPAALDECIRVHGPGLFSFTRFATRDTEVGGTPVLKDMPVFVSPQAANYDPTEYDDPQRLDVTRKPKSIMSFGTGPHHCIGIRLAKLTMEKGLAGLVRRFPGLRLADPDFQPVYSGSVGTLSITRLPMLTG